MFCCDNTNCAASSGVAKDKGQTLQVCLQKKCQSLKFKLPLTYIPELSQDKSIKERSFVYAAHLVL